MAIQIGTNFDLKSKQFLDSRQGLPETTSDLKGWSTPVPPGFEVCLEEVWYYYDPEVDLPETGHWIPRLVGKEELEGENIIINGENRGVTADAVKKIIEERLEDIQNQINNQEDINNPIKITSLWFGENTISSMSSPIEVEVGSTVSFTKNVNSSNTDPDLQGVITYNLKREKTPEFIVQGGKFYIPESSMKMNTGGEKTWTVKHIHQGVTYSRNASISWKWRTYWGIYIHDPLNIDGGDSTDDFIQLHRYGGLAGNSDFLTSDLDSEASQSNGKVSAKTFNCTNDGDEERHPVFLIPTNIYSGTDPIVRVQGLNYSDITVKYVLFETNSGLNAQYTAIFINQTQTGSNIEISIG